MCVPLYPTHLGPQVEVNFITPPPISSHLHLTRIKLISQPPTPETPINKTNQKQTETHETQGNTRQNGFHPAHHRARVAEHGPSRLRPTPYVLCFLTFPYLGFSPYRFPSLIHCAFLNSVTGILSDILGTHKQIPYQAKPSRRTSSRHPPAGRGRIRRWRGMFWLLFG